MANDFTVLMSVYAKEKPEYLKKSLESVLFDQTIPPKEMILVKDGKLTEGLDRVINEINVIHPMRIIELAENHGLGYALRIGMEQVRTSLVARMDSDDIAVHDRFESQLMTFEDHPQVDVLGGMISEFEGDPDKIYGYRVLPESDKEIKLLLKKRSPLNHMTVMARVEKILASGNYIQQRSYEDYYLWLRMQKNGSVFMNMPKVLVNVRAGNEMIRKRKGSVLFMQEMAFQMRALREGLMPFGSFLLNMPTRVLSRLFPRKLMAKVYKKYLRQKDLIG
jgi:glycosyltransferase involved in cell wall biosynthesis